MLTHCWPAVYEAGPTVKQSWMNGWMEHIDVNSDDLVMCKQIKWNESGFRSPLCTYRLNLASKTSWGWWDEWDDTVLQTQDSNFEQCRSEVQYATSRSRRLPTILNHEMCKYTDHNMLILMTRGGRFQSQGRRRRWTISPPAATWTVDDFTPITLLACGIHQPSDQPASLVAFTV